MPSSLPLLSTRVLVSMPAEPPRRPQQWIVRCPRWPLLLLDHAATVKSLAEHGEGLGQGLDEAWEWPQQSDISLIGTRRVPIGGSRTLRPPISRLPTEKERVIKIQKIGIERICAGCNRQGLAASAGMAVACSPAVDRSRP